MKIDELPMAIEVGDVWTKDVELDEMTGAEEDILADQRRALNGKGLMAVSGPERVTKILARCTVRLGTLVRPSSEARTTKVVIDFFEKYWREAYSSDRMFALIRLRQISLGNLYVFSEECPHCKATIKRVVSKLDELEVVRKTLAEASEPLRTFTFEKAKQQVKWRFFRGEEDESAIEVIRKNHKDRYLSMVLARRLVDVKDPVTFIESLKTSDRRAFAQHVDDAEGGIDMVITIVCDNCEQVFSKPLEVIGGSFFFPTVPQEASPSTSATSPKTGDGAETKSEASPSANAE